MNDDSTAVIGNPLSRVDGPLKITGRAKYAAEFRAEGIAQAVMVQSTIARGRIVRLDTGDAERAPGVLLVMTHRNAPALPDAGKAAINPPAGRTLSLLQDDVVHYNGQPIAVVVADTFERATAAAQLVRPVYQLDSPQLRFRRGQAKSARKARKEGNAPADVAWGDIDAGLAQGEVRVDAVYSTPMEHHNPMEPHATVAHWDGDKLTLYDATQYVSGVKETVAKTLGIPPDNVRVVDPYVGGGFGCKGSAWSHVVLAAMAARQAQAAREARARAPADVRAGRRPAADRAARGAGRAARRHADRRAS